MRIILLSIFIIFITINSYAQEITKVSDSEYTKTESKTINIPQKQEECAAIEAQYNALQARLTECQSEIDTAQQAQVGKSVDITPAAKPAEEEVIQ